MMFDDLFDLVDVVCDARFTDSSVRKWTTNTLSGTLSRMRSEIHLP